MTVFTESDRKPFRMRRIHQFDLSDHRPMQITSETKKLIPTIVRLARLMAVVEPEKQYKLPLDNQEEMEVQILAFRSLVNERYFPLFGYSEDDQYLDEVMDEQVDQWLMGWIDRTHHPLLEMVPVRPIGFSDHDVEPSDYGDVVALLHWLASADPKPPKFDSHFTVGEHWSVTERAKFRFSGALEVLPGMGLQSPLVFLPGLIRSVLHETGTFFLDACPLCGNYYGPEFTWSVENFIWFRDDWLVAKPIYDGNQELIKCSQRNGERLAEISSVLKKAWQIHQFYKEDQLPNWCL